MQSNTAMKFYIKTFGCQMNVYDSSRIADLLDSVGFINTNNPDDAEIIIYNTCHIREKAAEKVFSELGTKRKDGKILVLAGCVAQALDDYIFTRAPFVNIVVGPQSYHLLPQMLINHQNKIAKTDFPIISKFDYLPSRKPTCCSDYITIQEGCDKFCSYCVVPYTRGAEYSRPIGDIVKEAKELTDKGVKEITLLGQNVDAYEYNLATLLYKLAELKNLEIIRYITSYPSNITAELINAHKEIPKLAPFIHLPVQSGSNAILRAMNRKYTREQYIDIINAFREARADMAVSSDFIVGFPNETDKDFEDTISLVEKIGFSSAFAFKYSPRAGTTAATMNGQIDEKIKKERLDILLRLLNEQSESFNQSFIGKTVKTLVYKKSKKGLYTGKSLYMQTINIHSKSDIMNKIISVKITENGKNSITGEAQVD